MKRFVFISIFAFCNTLIVFSQIHFTKVWSGNGLDHMNFNCRTSKIEGVDLQAGDEIAVFDEEYCVGVGVAEGDGDIIYIVASRDDPETDEVDGYRTGNTASLLIWDASENIELSDLSIDILSGSMVFNISESVWFDLEAFTSGSDNTAPVVEDIPDQTIDEGGVFSPIYLSDYVEDAETVDDNIEWSYSGNTDLILSITDQVVTISIPDEDWYGSETITFTALDDDSSNPLSGSDEAVFTVNPVNDAPVITGQESLSVDEDESLTLTISDFEIEDADDPAGPFTLTVGSGTNYSVSGNTITPAADYNGTLTVSVSVSDGNDSSDPFDAKVTVNPVNDAPVITSTPEEEVDEGDLYSYTLTATDIDDASLTYSATDIPSWLTFSASTHVLSGIPSNDEVGDHDVTLQVSDGEDDVEQSFTITVNPVNDAPVITGQESLSVDEDESLTLTVSDFEIEDADDPAGPFALTVGSGTNYSVSGNTITPAADYNGTLMVSVSVSDGNDSSDPFDATVTVNPVNDAPVVCDIPNQGIALGSVFAVIHLDNYVTDVETSDECIIWTYSGNNYLIINITDRMATISTPDPLWLGQDTITFTATDNDLVNSLSASDDAVFIVTNENDPPNVTDIPDQTIDEGGAFAVIDLDDYVDDSETADQDINWSYVGNYELLVSIINRVVTITAPDPDWNGSETITFTATDDDDIPLSAFDEAIYTVNPINDKPSISYIPDQIIEEGETFNDIYLDDYVYDVETSDDLIEWSYFGNNVLGVSIENRKVTIALPGIAWTGSETISFVATDGDLTNPLSDTVEVVFTVNETIASQIHDISAENYIVYPNPTNGIVYVSINQPKDKEKRVEIIDELGEERKIMLISVNEGILEIDLAELNCGVYYIRITGSKTETKIFKVLLNP